MGREDQISYSVTVDLAALITATNRAWKVVQYLLEKLHRTGVVFSLDALPAQYKYSR